jgi:hypothetical protein
VVAAACWNRSRCVSLSLSLSHKHSRPASTSTWWGTTVQSLSLPLSLSFSLSLTLSPSLSLTHAQSTGVDVVGLDWTVDMGDARARLGNDVSLQGNIDPVILFAEHSAIEAAVRDTLAKVGGIHVERLQEGAWEV